MLELITNLLSPSQYIPHGHCYLWQTPLVWLHLSSDALIAIAYFSIPAMLIYFVRSREDVPFSNVFRMFGAFIILCGAGHLLDIWTLWHPAYWVSGVERAITALVSCYTALQLVELLPQFLAMRTPEQLEAINRRLEKQFEARTEELVTANAALESEIRERIVAELALQQSQEQFSKAFHSNPIACCISTLKDGRFLDANTSFLNFFGYSREEVIGKTSGELQTWTSQSDRDHLIQALQQQQSMQLDLSICIRSGEVREAIASFEKIELQGEVCLLSMIYDITERKQAEAEQLHQMKLAALRADIGTALTEGESLQDMLNRCVIALHEHLDAAFARIWTLNESEQILSLQASAGMYTHLNGEHSRIPVGQFKIGWIAQHRQPHLTNQVTTDPRVSDREWAQREGMVAFAGYPLTIRNRLLGVVALFARHPLPDRTLQELASVASAIAVGIDRKLAADQLRYAKEAADAANRAKSDFLANMSHELRTPLSIILGLTQLMNRDQALTTEHQRYLETISNSGEHLLGLINNVLEMSKIEAGMLTFHESNFNLHSLLNSLRDMLHFRCTSKGLQLSIESSSSLPQVIKTDEGKLRQILINLLGNAIKFTTAGRVTLRVSLVSPNSSGDAVHVRSQSKELPCRNISLLFEVEDTGPGITPDELQQLFKPFKQTQSGMAATEGTGLGLAISQKYAHIMGSGIAARSQLGQGSVFSFCISAELAELPIAKTKTASAGKVIRLAPQQPTYRILVAEDNAINRLLLTQLLDIVGFELREATNGQEAINLWRTWNPDLIFMDMRMPVMNGQDAVQQIRTFEEQSDGGTRTKVVALTANAFAEQQEEMIAAGCDDFICKPFKVKEIFETIARHLNVEYLYEATPDMTQEHASQVEGHQTLKTEMLRVMPSDWIERLHRAAAQGNDLQILKLMKDIPANHNALTKILKRLAENFQFDKITDVTSHCRLQQS